MMKSIAVALIFNLFDLVSGMLIAVKRHDVQSSKLRDGLFKKAGFLFCYALAYTVDHYSKYVGFQLGVPILPAVLVYAVTTEIVSIIENIHKLNPDLLPEKLMDLFHLEEVDNGKGNPRGC